MNHRSSYARALHRLRALTLAHNALTEVLETATEDVVLAAEAAAKAGGAPPMVMRGPNESGTHPRASSNDLHRRVRSVDIERYLREAWERAQTEEARAKVRDMALAARSTLDAEAEVRLRLLTG